jgi:hypothetical protein
MKHKVSFKSLWFLFSLCAAVAFVAGLVQPIREISAQR